MNSMIKKNWSFFALLLLIVTVLATNFSNSWLIGWDNLMSEFSLGLNIKRALSAVWQEYQGLGLLAGMAHGADLIRLAFLWLLSIVIPAQNLRMVTTLSMLAIGPIGMYFFVQNLLNNIPRQLVRITSFLSGAFYLLNLGTVQNFYVPFEPFTWAYGLFPWLFYSLIRYLKSRRMKDFILFSLTTLIATPMAYLQTVFVAYLMALTIFLLGYILEQKNLSSIKSSLKSFFSTLLVNSFWLLPIIYFVLTNSAVTINAKMNQIATSEVSLANQNFGDLNSISRLKGYWFDIHDTNESGNFVNLLGGWVDHTDKPEVQVIGYFAFILILFGLFYLLKLKKSFRYGLAGMFILVLIMLIGDNPPTGWLLSSINNSIPLFAQIFRSPFTKWAVPAIFVYSILFGLGGTSIAKSMHNGKRPTLSLLVLITAGLIFQAAPIFKGDLFYKHIKLDIPQEYLSLFEYFKSQEKEKRIALLPVHTKWGWNNYDWGYRGSGFLWYGIEQPILDRAFDVWSRENETFYNQFSHAVYSNDPSLVEEVMGKFDVALLILDNSINVPNIVDSPIQMEQLISKLNGKVVWQKGSLIVFELSPTKNGGFLTVPNQVTKAGIVNDYSLLDQAYHSTGTYLNQSGGITYPFSSNDNRGGSIVSTSQESVTLSSPLVIKESDGKINLPDYKNYSWPIGLFGEVATNKFILTAKTSIPGIKLGDSFVIKPQTIQQKLEILFTDIPEYIFIKGKAVNISHVLKTGNQEFLSYINGSFNQPMNVKLGNVKETIADGKEIFTNLVGQSSLTINGDFSEHQIKGLTGSNNITIVYPLIKSNDGLSRLTPSKNDNCDVLKRGSFTRTIANNKISYLSVGGAAACDFSEYKHLEGFDGYVLRVAGENIKGRGVKAHLLNLGNNRIDLEELLPQGKFDQSFIVDPTSNQGYSLHLETKSFGHKSENNISAVNLIPFPLAWTRDISIGDSNKVNTRNNLITLSDEVKQGTGHYNAKVKSQQTDSLIQLSQGFNRGWQAFIYQDTNSFDQLIPWARGTELEHVKVNSWANGWLVPVGEYDLIIIFWPQYLQYLGFALLGFGVIYLVKAKQV